MSDRQRPPTDNAAEAPGASGRTPPERPAAGFDTVEAARIAGAALGLGRAGLRTAWRKGRETAAARGVTEESVRRTVDRGRAIAAEQARRRGRGQAEPPRWPGDLAGTPDDRPPVGSPAAERRVESPAAERPGGGRGRDHGTAGESSRRSLTRTVAASALTGVPSIAGRRRFGIFPAAAPDSAAIERRLGAFALDLAVFGAAFVVFVAAADILLGVAFGGSGSDGDWLGLSLLELLRVAAFVDLGDVATGSAPGAVFGVQLLHLLGLAVYTIGAEANYGATIGKRLLGLRVVPSRRGQGRIGLRAAAIRNACRLYDVVIPLWPLALLDLIFTLLSRRRQRSGDWFAGTVVVGRQRSPEAASTAGPSAVRGRAADGASHRGA